MQSVLLTVENKVWLWLGAIAVFAVVAIFRVRRRRRRARFAAAFEAQMPPAPEERTEPPSSQLDGGPDAEMDEDSGDAVARLLAILSQGVDIQEAAAQCGMSEDEACVVVACYDPARD